MSDWKVLALIPPPGKNGVAFRRQVQICVRRAAGGGQDLDPGLSFALMEKRAWADADCQNRRSMARRFAGREGAASAETPPPRMATSDGSKPASADESSHGLARVQSCCWRLEQLSPSVACRLVPPAKVKTRCAPRSGKPGKSNLLKSASRSARGPAREPVMSPEPHGGAIDLSRTDGERTLRSPGQLQGQLGGQGPTVPAPRDRACSALQIGAGHAHH